MGDYLTAECEAVGFDPSPPLILLPFNTTQLGTRWDHSRSTKIVCVSVHGFFVITVIETERQTNRNGMFTLQQKTVACMTAVICPYAAMCGPLIFSFTFLLLLLPPIPWGWYRLRFRHVAVTINIKNEKIRSLLRHPVYARRQPSY